MTEKKKTKESTICMFYRTTKINENGYRNSYVQCIHLSPEATIRELKKCIEKKEGFDLAKIYNETTEDKNLRRLLICYGGKMISNLDATLEDYNIKKYANINIWLALLGGE